MNNLIGDSHYANIKTRLSAGLDHWLTAQGDPGAAIDTYEALRASKRGIHNFGPKE
jgi:hypothetical protein